MGLAIALVIHSVDPSLSSQLILLLSKIELVSSTTMASNTTYAVPAVRNSEMGSLMVVQRRSQSNRLWYGNLQSHLIVAATLPDARKHAIPGNVKYK